MKKLLIATCLFCIAGFLVACDKDDDSANQFAKTTWKNRTLKIDYQEFYHYIYEVYRFESSSRFSHWVEDDSGARITGTSYGTYVVKAASRQLVLSENGTDGTEKTFDYSRQSPVTAFWYIASESDTQILFYKQ